MKEIIYLSLMDYYSYTQMKKGREGSSRATTKVSQSEHLSSETFQAWLDKQYFAHVPYSYED